MNDHQLIPLYFFFPPPPHQRDRKQDCEQGDVMQHQQELSADKRADGPQRVPLVVLVSFDAEAVVVTEVHGKNVVCHVWHAVPDDKVGGQPVPETKKMNVNSMNTSVLFKSF